MSNKHPKEMLPEKFLARLSRIIPEDRLSGVLDSLSARRLTTLRANTLKISGAALDTKLRTLGIECEAMPWWENAFVVKNVTLRILTELDLYREGYFYVQRFSSMLPPLILAPLPGERVLDITAAPGSKTTQMAALMENKGEILANDLSHIRLLKLRANLKIQGVTNVTVNQDPGQIIWRRYQEYFDRVLADVPCSMEGRIDTTDPKTYADWSTVKIRELMHRQRFLLKSAVSAAKVGGTIVYSTCTLSPEENEGVIDWLVRKVPGIDVETVNLPGVPLVSPLIGWNERVYVEQVSRTVRLLPDRHWEGFYVAKLRKTGRTTSTI